MSGARGGGYGLDAHLASQAATKYDHELEAQVRAWMEQVTGERFGNQSFAERLKDGVMLCNLVNAIKPGTVQRVNSSAMPFKKMENISAFLRACRTMGVAEYAVFETCDLFEEKDMNAVLQGIFSLARAIQTSVPEFRGPTLGPREAERNERTFTEQQRKEAMAAPSILNLGSNATMARSETSRAGDITFGHDAAAAGITNAASLPPSVASSGAAAAATTAAAARAPAARKPPPPRKPGQAAAPASASAASANRPPPPAPVVSRGGISTGAAAGGVYESQGSARPAPGSNVSHSTAAPTGTRGAGFGLDAAIAQSRAAQYDHELEAQVRAWMEQVTGERFGNQSFAERLKDGVMLCNLVNAIKPGTVQRVNSSAMPFKKMENISAFLRACRTMGVAEYAVFETCDLFEEKDMNAVLQGIFSLARAIQTSVPEFRGPTLGPREAAANKREFTEQQVREATAQVSKLNMGAHGVMERSAISTAASVTFGAEHAGQAVDSSVSQLNQGSTAERAHISRAQDITFGHDAANS